MYLTEEEARKKRCVILLAAIATVMPNVSEGTPQEKVNALTGMTECMASECMMWRWRTPRLDRNYKSGGNIERRTPKEIEFDKNTPDGYCGLAGKP